MDPPLQLSAVRKDREEEVVTMKAASAARDIWSQRDRKGWCCSYWLVYLSTASLARPVSDSMVSSSELWFVGLSLGRGGGRLGRGVTEEDGQGRPLVIQVSLKSHDEAN